MMKLLFTIICLLTLNILSVLAADIPEIQLTTEIVSQRYCEGDADLDGLDLNLKLRFENKSNQQVILYKDSQEIDQLIVRKSSDIFGDKEISSMITWLISDDWKVDESSLSEAFVVLPPKAIHQIQTTARVFVRRKNTDKIVGSVGDGEHYLQIRVSTWYGSRELADRLQQSWKQAGFLWTNSILSSPMKFKVDAKRKVARCE